MLKPTYAAIRSQAAATEAPCRRGTLLPALSQLAEINRSATLAEKVRIRCSWPEESRLTPKRPFSNMQSCADAVRFTQVISEGGAADKQQTADATIPLRFAPSPVVISASGPGIRAMASEKQARLTFSVRSLSKLSYLRRSPEAKFAHYRALMDATFRLRSVRSWHVARSILWENMPWPTVGKASWTRWRAKQIFQVQLGGFALPSRSCCQNSIAAAATAWSCCGVPEEIPIPPTTSPPATTGRPPATTISLPLMAVLIPKRVRRVG